MSNYTTTQSIPDSDHSDIKSIAVDFEEGIHVELLNLGATIRILEVPDRAGNRQNVVLSYEKVTDYLTDSFFLGCTVGRFANRISKGRFSLGGKEFELSQNQEENHLHGGLEGFSKKIWNVERVEEREDEVSIVLSYDSLDGEEGYPGNLQVSVEYLIKLDGVEIIYTATTDKDTPFSPTNHSYFNLSGDASEEIDNHHLMIESAERLEMAEDQIPTGIRLDLKDSQYDFSTRRKIGPQAYDDTYVLNGDVELSNADQTIKLTIGTTLPSIQLYTADSLSGGFKRRTGICVEPQFFPDSPNHEEFPSCILKKGEVAKHKIGYHFEWT
ncbi:MAG: galactose mutarotase [Ekhidna sp.]|nr:galactose mutarotase [Ekhidna sp.]